MPFEPVTPRLAPLCRAHVLIGEPLVVGHTPLGARRIIPITGGRVEGPRLEGVVVPGGADWQIVRGDGAAVLEARYTIRSAEGALIYVRNVGVRVGPPEVLARLGRGEPITIEDIETHMDRVSRRETSLVTHVYYHRRR